jgi:hypothetical protein
MRKKVLFATSTPTGNAESCCTHNRERDGTRFWNGGRTGRCAWRTTSKCHKERVDVFAVDCPIGVEVRDVQRMEVWVRSLERVEVSKRLEEQVNVFAVNAAVPVHVARPRFANANGPARVRENRRVRVDH